MGVIAPTPTAVSYVRFFQPFARLAGRAELVTLGERLRLRRSPAGWSPEPTLLDGIDRLIFPQFVAAPRLSDGTRLELVEPLCALARERGVPIVYSVDDHLQASDPLNPVLDELVGSSGLSRLLDSADAVIATTEPLADVLADDSRPTFVIPNCIDPRLWSERPRRSRALRIGWAGSSSHLPDLEMVLPALVRLRERLDFELVIYGLTELPLSRQLHEIRRSRLEGAQRERADAFRRIAALLRELDAEHHPFESVELFPQRLAGLDLDIGLCPLVETPFSICKSALKFYEYAACGTLTLASDVLPYRDEPALTVENDADAWCDALERLARDASLRLHELSRQRDFVLSHRDIRTHAENWIRSLSSVRSREVCHEAT